MLVISVRVSHVVLHMPDDGILPVGDIKGTIASDFDIAGSEIRVARNDDWLDFLTGDVGAVVLDLVLQNPQKADAVADQEIALVLFWEQTARKDSRSGHRAYTHFEPLLVSDPFADVDIGTRTASAIVGELITPLVEHIPVRIRSDRKVKFHFESARVEAVDSTFP